MVLANGEEVNRNVLFFWTVRFNAIPICILKAFISILDMSEGDWTCPKCGNTNFAFRTICNMRKCNTPKPVAQVSFTFRRDLFVFVFMIP